MEKCYIHTLGMMVTNDCNLDCKSCMRGKKNKNCMSDEVIEATLDQIRCVGILNIEGGEPTFAIPQIEKIVKGIGKRCILIDAVAITINGTIYSEKLLELLDTLNSYNIKTYLSISVDKYHLEEMQKLGLLDNFLESVAKYKMSKHFFEFRLINNKLFREGNAINLDENITVPLRAVNNYITYVGRKKRKLCNIGPLLTINTNGTITEPNASLENQETIYNYGNILDGSIVESLINSGAKVLKPREFKRATAKELKRYMYYEK